MLVVSDVLTTIEPSGLTATPSGSTPTGIRSTDLALRCASIAVNRASFSLATKSELAVWADAQLFGVGARRQFADIFSVLVSRTRNRIVVAERNMNSSRTRPCVSAMPRGRWPDLDRLHHLELVEVDDGDRIAFLIGDIGGSAWAGAAAATKRRDAEERAANCHAFIIEVCILSPAGRGQGCRVPTSDAGSLPAAKPRRVPASVGKQDRLTQLLVPVAQTSGATPLKAASAKSGPRQIVAQLLGSADFVRATASPIMRIATQAWLSRAFMLRLERAHEAVLQLNCAPHSSCEGSQLVGTRPAEPATGRASQVR